MKVIERIDRQVDQVTELVNELAKEKSYRGTERLVQLVVQSLLDLGLMMITALGGKTPKGYSDIGELLSGLGAVEESDAKLLRSMAGMRNVLVHAYAIVRSDLVTDASRRLADDAPRIARNLRRKLEGRVLDPPSPDDFMKDLKDVLKDKVKAALLFGGRAKGYTMKGDYDVAIYFGRDYDLYEVGGLVVDIAEALGVHEDQLDILVLDSAEPELALEALGGELIYAEDLYVLFELKVRLMEFLDLQSGMDAISDSESRS